MFTKKSKTYLDDLSSTFVAIKIYEKHDNDNNNDDVDNGAKVNSKLGLGTSTAPGLRFRHLGKSGLKVGSHIFFVLIRSDDSVDGGYDGDDDEDED